MAGIGEETRRLGTPSSLPAAFDPLLELTLVSLGYKTARGLFGFLGEDTPTSS